MSLSGLPAWSCCKDIGAQDTEHFLVTLTLHYAPWSLVPDHYKSMIRLSQAAQVNNPGKPGSASFNLHLKADYIVSTQAAPGLRFPFTFTCAAETLEGETGRFAANNAKQGSVMIVRGY